MEIKIAVGGAMGRVGRFLTQLAKEDPHTKLVASVVRPNNLKNSSSHSNIITSELKFTRESQETCGEYIEHTRGLAAVTVPFDVFIDFSSIESFEQHLGLCCERKQRMVIGVTGLSTEHKNQLQQASKIIPIVYSPNMSIGINVSFRLLEIAATALSEEVSVAIHETHHRHKKDKPSGTALRMGEIIAKAWHRELPCSEIDFASSRVGEVMGEHRILFALANENLEISHKTENRSVYAIGALKAAKWLMHQTPGLYDMQDVLSLRG